MKLQFENLFSKLVFKHDCKWQNANEMHINAATGGEALRRKKEENFHLFLKT
jgi:hypothetical protein